MRSSIVLTCLVVATTARADTKQPKSLPTQLVELTSGQGSYAEPLENATPPRFAFAEKTAAVSPQSFEDCATLLSDYASSQGKPVVGKSADGKSVWVATDIEYEYPCGMEGCDKIIAPRVHATGLMDTNGHAVAWHVGRVIVGAEKPPSPKRGKPIAPPKLADGIDAGAEDVAKLFKASFADPKELAKTISDRKDAVMLGSEASERYVGGSTMRATLLKWNLGFTVRDGTQAGLAASKKTAWVAANVDAAKKGDKKATPYRVLAIYDNKGTTWQLVLVHFSTVTADKN